MGWKEEGRRQGELKGLARGSVHFSSVALREIGMLFSYSEEMMRSEWDLCVFLKPKEACHLVGDDKIYVFDKWEK